MTNAQPDASPCSRHYDPTLYSLIAREALYKLDELRPLGLATLLSAWAATGYFNVSLFALAGAAVTQQLDAFHPATLVRVLDACNQVRRGLVFFFVFGVWGGLMSSCYF